MCGAEVTQPKDAIKTKNFLRSYNRYSREGEKILKIPNFHSVSILNS